MIVAAYQEWPWWEYAFLSDNSPVAWLSSALLVANAAVALGLTLSGSLTRFIGYPLTAGWRRWPATNSFSFTSASRNRPMQDRWAIFRPGSLESEELPSPCFLVARSGALVPGL
jgi:hypothetical protein